MPTIETVLKSKNTAVMPYYPIGYPDYSTSLDIIEGICASGADIIELGVPFSDPLADGPTIQAATQVALANGITLQYCLDGVSALRARGIQTPIVLMSYFNPILRYGVKEFTAAASEAKADGAIIPDLPPDEAGSLIHSANEVGFSTIFLLTPNSTPDRIELVTRLAKGFIYLVSVTGITGARAQLSPDLENFIRAVREKTDLPLAVGFGISTPEQVSVVGVHADGVIIGSALIDRVNDSIRTGADPVEAAKEFILELEAATR
jgi:tryptophan synthase alpha chain